MPDNWEGRPGAHSSHAGEISDAEVLAAGGELAAGSTASDRAAMKQDTHDRLEAFGSYPCRSCGIVFFGDMGGRIRNFPSATAA